MWFPNMSDTNWPVKLQRMVRSLKFLDLESMVEELYYPCSENKGADQLRSYCVFAYANYWFSHEAAHMTSVAPYRCWN